MPALTLNTVPLSIATFEDGMGDTRERPGLTGRMVRERTSDPERGTNTVLKVINMYPAGDFSTTLVGSERNLDTTPMLHFDYCFDPGVQVNLYVRKQATWYEFLLTGKEAPGTKCLHRRTRAGDGGRDVAPPGDESGENDRRCGE